MNLFQEFTTIAKRYPDKLAIVTNNVRLTYGELEKKVEGLYNKIAETQISPQDHVGIILPNGIEFVIATLAIWKAEGIVTPLHVSYQEAEISRYMTDCQIDLFITAPDKAPAMQLLKIKRESVANIIMGSPAEGDWHTIKGPKMPDPSKKFSQNNELSALTQYSTGSTGLSKRVTRTHKNLILEHMSVAQVIGLTSNDSIFGAAPYFHSYGFMNAMLFGLLSGATLYPVANFFPRDAVKLIEQEKITGFPGVPFMFEMLTKFSGKADMSSLRYILSAGAPLAEKTGEAFLSRFGIAIRQLYGTTETGVITINGRMEDTTTASSVGFPIPGVSVDVVGEYNQKLPIGVDGNIAVRSPFAASSYDGETKKGESYFTNGYFFPGDMGRFGESGRITLSGRRRMFISVAGNKVDPTEVEAVLKELPAVREVAVVGVPDEAEGEIVKAVLVTSSECTRLEILEHCRNKLAKFKHPKMIEYRKEILKSPLGKVLRKYLVEPAVSEKKETFPGAFPDAKSSNDANSGESWREKISMLPPILRVLSLNTGSSIKMIESYFSEATETKIVSQGQIPSGKESQFIAAEVGESLLKTQLAILGTETGRPYGFLQVFITKEFLTGMAVAQLLKEDDLKPLAEIEGWIASNKLETYKEIIEVDCKKAGELSAELSLAPSDMVLTRWCRIFFRGRPLILLTETFPEKLYESGENQIYSALSSKSA